MSAGLPHFYTFDLYFGTDIYKVTAELYPPDHQSPFSTFESVEIADCAMIKHLTIHLVCGLTKLTKYTLVHTHTQALLHAIAFFTLSSKVHGLLAFLIYLLQGTKFVQNNQQANIRKPCINCRARHVVDHVCYISVYSRRI